MQLFVARHCSQRKQKKSFISKFTAFLLSFPSHDWPDPEQLRFARSLTKPTPLRPNLSSERQPGDALPCILNPLLRPITRSAPLHHLAPGEAIPALSCHCPLERGVEHGRTLGWPVVFITSWLTSLECHWLHYIWLWSSFPIIKSTSGLICIPH